MTYVTTIPLVCIALFCGCDYDLPNDPTDAGTGGSGSDGIECTTSDDCGNAHDRCEHQRCADGVCVREYDSEGTPGVIDAVRGDCASPVCDGRGASTMIFNADDYMDDGNECTIERCYESGQTRTVATDMSACGTEESPGVCASGNCATSFWSEPTSIFYAFSSSTVYAPNDTDDTALTAYVPDATAGDVLKVEAHGWMYSNFENEITVCSFRIHVSMVGAGDVIETPIDDGGYFEMPIWSDPDSWPSLDGSHRMDVSGIARFRILGRSSTDGVVCGLVGPVELRVIHERY